MALINTETIIERQLHGQCLDGIPVSLTFGTIKVSHTIRKSYGNLFSPELGVVKAQS
jgi:hypothetical protein